MRFVSIFFSVLCSLLMLSFSANASVVLSGTRIIFPSNEKEVTVKLTNEGDKAGLIQVWLDKGEKDIAPEKVNVPFILTPPLFRLDPQKGQTLRLLMMQKGRLPNNQESVFWLNVLEVPPKHVSTGEPAEEEGNNFMQMAFKTRIKVFYRPSQFNDSAQLNKAYQQLNWILQRHAGMTPSLDIKNTSPYYITVSRMSGVNGHASVQSKEGVMVPPFGEITIPVEHADKLREGEQIEFSVLNDYGGELTFTAKITS